MEEAGASSDVELPPHAGAGAPRLVSEGADGEGAAEEAAAREHAEPASQAAPPADPDASLGDVPLVVGRGETGGQDGSCRVRGRDDADADDRGAVCLDSELVFVNLNLSGRGLAFKDVVVASLTHPIDRSSDPYLVLKQGDEVVTKTEVAKHTCDPDWRRLHLHLVADTPVVIEAWDWDRLSSHDLIGKATVSVEDLLVNDKLIRLTSDGHTSGFVQVLPVHL